jgi:hypothetical protein
MIDWHLHIYDGPENVDYRHKKGRCTIAYSENWEEYIPLCARVGRRFSLVDFAGMSHL